MKTAILTLLVVIFVAIQFVPYGRNHTNPQVTGEPQWESPTTRESFMRVCGNCHSNETDWPWYSSLAPVSWLVQHDVDDGRKHLNVSEWNPTQNKHAAEVAEVVMDREMPPWFYVLGHPEAKMSIDQRDTLAHSLEATFRQSR